MQYQTLGGSDLRVSRLCMGNMNFSTQIDQAMGDAILDAALDVGYNFIDTAEMYPVPTSMAEDLIGTPEVWLGEWLKGRQRDQVVIATKVVGPSGMKSIPPQRVPPMPAEMTRLDRASILAAAEGCLARLQTDYIDLFQVHWPARYIGSLWGDMRYHQKNEREPSADFDEIAGTMDELVKAGKIRQWGVSNETTFGVCKYDEACRTGGYAKPISIQNDFSLMNRTFEPELAEACSPRNLNIDLLVYGGLAGGALSGKYLDDPAADGRHTQYPNFQPRYHGPKARAATAEYVALAKENGMTGTELALAWMLSLDYVGSVITGASKPEQIAEHARATELKLDDELIAKIDNIQHRHQNPANWTQEAL